MEFEIEVTITKKVEHRESWSCLVGAFEGGSSYWARSDVSDYNGLTRINHGDPLMKEENERRLKEHTEKTGETWLPFRMKCEDDFEWLAENKRYIYTHQIPFLGGELTIYDLESREWSEEEEERTDHPGIPLFDIGYFENMGTTSQYALRASLGAHTRITRWR